MDVATQSHQIQQNLGPPPQQAPNVVPHSMHPPLTTASSSSSLNSVASSAIMGSPQVAQSPASSTTSASLSSAAPGSIPSPLLPSPQGTSFPFTSSISSRSKPPSLASKVASLPLLLPHPVYDQPKEHRPPPLIYSAVYSGVPVYEMVSKGVPVMRRISDGYINATQILKVAGFSKPRRTKILEKEVLHLEHEKVQGGYGKYQGTWVPRELARELARRYRVEDDLQPLIDFEDPDGELMNKSEYLNFVKLGGTNQVPPSIVAGTSYTSSLSSNFSSSYHISSTPTGGVSKAYSNVPTVPPPAPDNYNTPSAFSISSLIGSSEDVPTPPSHFHNIAPAPTSQMAPPSINPYTGEPLSHRVYEAIASSSSTGKALKATSGRGSRKSSPAVSGRGRGRRSAAATAAAAVSAAAATMAAAAAGGHYSPTPYQHQQHIQSLSSALEQTPSPDEPPGMSQAVKTAEELAYISSARGGSAVVSDMEIKRSTSVEPNPALPYFGVDPASGPTTPTAAFPPPQMGYNFSYDAAQPAHGVKSGYMPTPAGGHSESGSPGKGKQGGSQQGTPKRQARTVEPMPHPAPMPIQPQPDGDYDLDDDEKAAMGGAEVLVGGIEVKEEDGTDDVDGADGEEDDEEEDEQDDGNDMDGAVGSLLFSKDSPARTGKGGKASGLGRNASTIAAPNSSVSLLPSTSLARRILTKEQRQQEVLMGIFMDTDPSIVVSLLREPLPLRGNVSGGMPAKKAEWPSKAIKEPKAFAADAHTKWGLGPANPDMYLDDRNRTPLHWAAAFGRVKIVKALVAAGANLFAVSSQPPEDVVDGKEGGSVLGGDGGGSEEIPELVAGGASLEDAHTLTSFAGGAMAEENRYQASTKLATEAPKDTIRAVTPSGAPTALFAQPSASGEALNDRGGEVPLLRAATTFSCFEYQNFPEMLRLLEPTIRAANHDGHTLLHRIAERSGYPGQAASSLYYLKCVREWVEGGGFVRMAKAKLVSHATASAPGAIVPLSVTHPTQHQIEAEGARMVEALLNAQDDFGETALHMAVRARCRPVVQMLLRMGAAKDVAAYDGTTVFELADEGSRMMSVLRHGKVMAGSSTPEVSAGLLFRGAGLLAPGLRGASPALSDVSFGPGGAAALILSSSDDSVGMARAQLLAAQNEIEDLQLSKKRLNHLQEQALELKRRAVTETGRNSPTPAPPVTSSLINKTAPVSIFGTPGKFTPAVPSPLVSASVPVMEGGESWTLTVKRGLSDSSSSGDGAATSSSDDGRASKRERLSSPEAKDVDANTMQSVVSESSPMVQSPTKLTFEQGDQAAGPNVMSVPSIPEMMEPRIQWPSYHSVMDRTLSPSPVPADYPAFESGSSSSPVGSVVDPALLAEVTALQQKLDASERSRKRMFDELEGMRIQRKDKDRRYKRLLANACNVPTEKMDELLQGPI